MCVAVLVGCQGHREKKLKHECGLCVCCHEIFSKIFAQRPPWMSEITSELELDPPLLKNNGPAFSLSHSVASESSLFHTLIYSFFYKLLERAFPSSPPMMTNHLLLACIEPITECVFVCVLRPSELLLSCSTCGTARFPKCTSM